MLTIACVEQSVIGKRWIALPLLAILVGGLAALLASNAFNFALAAAGLLFIGFAVLAFHRPLVFVITFLVALIVLPPFFHPRLGETPIYASTILFPVGVAVLLLRLPDFRFRFDPIAKGLFVFLFGTALSLPVGFWLSGTEVGLAGLLRWLLVAQAGLIYILVRGGTPHQEGRAERLLVPIVVVAAVLTAVYGIVDFFWPIPLPRPAAEQYIWLSSAVMRRAQGVFFEASNFANFCAFFLVLTAAAYVARKESALGLRRFWLLMFIPVFALAIVVTFSRSAWGCAATATFLFAVTSGVVKRGRAFAFLLAMGLPLAALWFYAPELWSYLVDVRLPSFAQIFVDPDVASAGRLETWRRVRSILEDNPQYLLLGVGYKTLPFTRRFGPEITTDNGFLNLLLEAGVVGLGSFLFFSVAVFRTFWSLARRREGKVAFWGGLLFSFWWGEWVQMLAIDAYTYWRNVTVFVALMAFALNLAERKHIRGDATTVEPNSHPTRVGDPL